MNYSKSNSKKIRSSLTSKKRKKAGKRKAFIIKSIISLILIIMLLAIGYGLYILKDVISSTKDVSPDDIKPKKYTTIIKDEKGNEIERLAGEGSNRIWYSIDNIPKYTKDAFVAIEDARFYKHGGIDPKGIIRAFVIGIKNKGQFTQGASTITQQTIKNNIFPSFMFESTFKDRLTRKIREIYLAIKIEKTLSKDEILESYLNTINLGHNCLGIKSASNRYFGKEASDLTLSESAVIAAITQNPTRYDPIVNPEYNKKRRTKVLDDMLSLKMINQKEYSDAISDDVYSRIQTVNTNYSKNNDVNSYFVDTLIEQVLNDLHEQKGYTKEQALSLLYTGGLDIIATQDTKIQKICDEEMNNPDNYPASTKVELSYTASVMHSDGSFEAFDNNTMLSYMQSIYGKDEYTDLTYNNSESALQALESYKSSFIKDGDTLDEIVSLIPQPQASFIILDQKTGEVKALVGGRGEKNASLTLNRASNTVRQPGSCFKILSTYAPAIDIQKYSLATSILDEPFKYDDGTPVKNWYGDYRGAVSVRTAIEQSMNICAVKTLTSISPSVGFKYLENFGFTTLDKKNDVYQALALGGITNGVTNLELTSAFSSIANYGTRVKPRFYTKILDHDGNTLLENEVSEREILKPSTACLITDAMKGVVTRGTGTAASIGEMPVSGKTGTSTNSDNETVDLWFAGYTPYYTAGIWAGNDDSKRLIDGVWHEVIWSKIMKRVHENLETKEFDYKSLIEKKNICAYTGLLTTSSCPYVYEYFAKDSKKKCSGNHAAFTSYIKKNENEQDTTQNKKKDNPQQKIDLNPVEQTNTDPGNPEDDEPSPDTGGDNTNS